MIIGRPNVGKSTLFNRLIGRRQAICHSEPGVTRDIVTSRCRLNGVECMLSDTGGMSGDGRGLELLCAERSITAARGAHLVLLVLSAEGMVAEDEELIERLRPLSQRVLCVVNKADNEIIPAGEFYALGLGEPIAISSEQGRNIDLLRLRISAGLGHASNDDPVAEPADGPTDELADGPTDRLSEPGGQQEQSYLRIAIAGQPNSGKSTLLNALTKSDTAVVSEAPGTTRDAVAAEFFYNTTPISYSGYGRYPSQGA